MELRHYLGVASRYRWHLIVVPIIAALIALAATFVVSARYQGVATVQIIPAEAEPRTLTFRTEDGTNLAALGLRDPTELIAQALIEHLATREAGQYVVDRLDLLSRPPLTGWDAFKSEVMQHLRDVWTWLRYGYVVKKDRAGALVDETVDALSARLVRGSYFMKVTASWRDPQTASDMANAAVEAITLRSQRLASQAAAERRRFLEQQMNEDRARVEAAREALVRYSQQHDVVAGVSVRTAEATLSDTRTQLWQVERALAEARSRLAEVDNQLAKTPAEQMGTTSTQARVAAEATTVEVTAPNPTYLTLQERVAGLEQEVAALERRRTASEVELRAQLASELAAARARLQSARSQLAAAEPETTSVQTTTSPDGPTNSSRTATTTASSLYVALQQQVATLAGEVEALEARQRLSLDELRAQNERALAEARARLGAAREQLDATEPQSTSRQVTQVPVNSTNTATTIVGPNPVYTALVQRQQELQQEVAGQQARRDQLAAAVSDQEQALRQVVSQDAQLTALNQELTIASETYTRRATAWANALMEEARPVLQVRSIERAVAPLYPVSPVKILWVLIGAAVGLVVAGIWVFVLDSTDMALRTPRRASEELDLPVLSVIPLRPDRSSGSGAGIRRGGEVS